MQDLDTLPRFDYVDVLIGKDGELSAEVHGAKGPACTTLLDKLLGGLGRIAHRRRKREYYQQQRSGTGRQRVGGSGRER